jgi:hypothetical protein
MGTMQLLVVVILGLMSIFLLAFGFLIMKYQLADIIAGYDDSKVMDKTGLARLVGINLITIGIIGMFIVLAGMILNFENWLWFILIFVIVLFVFCFRILLGQKRYQTL